MTEAQRDSFIENKDELSEKSQEVLDALKEHGPCTYHKLCQVMTLQMNTITSRLHDLENHGYVRIIGQEYNDKTKRHNSIYEALETPIKAVKTPKFKEHVFTQYEANEILNGRDVGNKDFSVRFDNGKCNLIFKDLVMNDIDFISKNTDGNLVLMNKLSTTMVRVIRNKE